MGITCNCGRFYTQPLPEKCNKCGRALIKSNTKQIPPQINKANFGYSIRLTRHIRRH
jgi:hypothetical protein